MSTSTDNLLLVGGYGREILCLRHDAAGALTAVAAIPIEAPSYVAYDAARGVVHAVVEQEKGGFGSAFFTPGAGPREVAAATSTDGADPCHLAVHPLGGHVFVANYSSGSVAVLPVDADGRVTAAGPVQLVQHVGGGPRTDRQEGPHAHQVLMAPDGRFLLVADLGTDTVYTYSFDAAAGRLSEATRAVLPGGSGPRHLAFHESGQYAYVLNELASTITVCGYDAESGTLTTGASQSCRAADADPAGRNWPAAVRVSADGRFVYVSNRVDDTIVVFAASDEGATLTRVQAVPAGGSWPRDIAFSKDGTLLFAANQKSDSLTVFRVDAENGTLTAVGEPFAVATPSSVLAV